MTPPYRNVQGKMHSRCDATWTAEHTYLAKKAKSYDFWAIFGLWGHPEIGTAITECFEHLDDEKHILDPGQLHPSPFVVSLTIRRVLNHPLCPWLQISSSLLPAALEK